MKAGISLTEMAVELERQQQTKKDFVATNAAVEMTPDANLALKNTGTFEVTPHAHDQLATYLNIPRPYYDRLRANDPALLAANVNRWLHDKATATESRMVRTLDNRARAFLSGRYRPLDNHDLIEAVLPVLMEDKQLRVESTALTETRMYIKAVTARLTAEVKVGDVVQAGIAISNSEIGVGMVKVEPLVFTLRCLNGMIAIDSSLRKYHVGRNHGNGDGDVSEFFRDETRQLDDRAFFMKVQDVVRAAFNEVLFNRLVDKLRGATDDRVTGDPVKVVEVTAKKFNLNDDVRGSVLRHLIEGRDLSRYGLLNAVTAASQEDTVDYEQATAMERLGGEILELPKTDWKVLAEAA